MDMNKVLEEAKGFENKDGSCFMHLECEKGEHHAVLVGDGKEIMTALAILIDQIAVSSQQSYAAVLSHLFFQHKIIEEREKAGASRTEATAFVLPKKRNEEEKK